MATGEALREGGFAIFAIFVVSPRFPRRGNLRVARVQTAPHKKRSNQPRMDTDEHRFPTPFPIFAIFVVSLPGFPVFQPIFSTLAVFMPYFDHFGPFLPHFGRFERFFDPLFAHFCVSAACHRLDAFLPRSLHFHDENAPQMRHLRLQAPPHAQYVRPPHPRRSFTRLKTSLYPRTFLRTFKNPQGNPAR